MRSIKVSSAVWTAIAAIGKFGETEDDVLRRVFKLPPGPPKSSENVPNKGDHSGGGSPASVALRRGRGGRRYSTNALSARVRGNVLSVEIDGHDPQEFMFPNDRTDRAEIKKARRQAHEHARSLGATQGQIDAITKALNEAGYYTQRRGPGSLDIEF